MPFKSFVKETKLKDMAEAARVMVKSAIDSFVNNDPKLAHEVLESDDTIDSIDRDMFVLMVKTMKKSSELIEPAVHMVILSRHLERLADHATNIAEDVIFLVNARIIKHNVDEQL
jgi:phosphate transport system protein